MTAFLLLLLGLLLVFIEFFVPGMVMGIAGGILIFLSIVKFASESNSAIAIILYILFAFSSLALLIKYTLWKIRTTKTGFSIYSNKDQQGYFASEYDKKAIGKKGIVLTDLKPGGYISIDGVTHQAISLTGYIPKEAKVIVVSGEAESLYVKEILNE